MKLSPALIAIAIPFAALAACSKPAEAPAPASTAVADSAAPSTDAAPGSTADQGGAVSGPQANGAINADANTANANVTAASNSFTEGEAKGHIENAGYSDVTALTKSPDGVWTAKAKKGGKTVDVALDFKGAVTAK